MLLVCQTVNMLLLHDFILLISSIHWVQVIRACSDEQCFLPNSLPKLHAIQSTVTIFYGI